MKRRRICEVKNVDAADVTQSNRSWAPVGRGLGQATVAISQRRRTL